MTAAFNTQERALTADELVRRELTTAQLDNVVGGTKSKPDGTAAGNVAAKWSLAQGAAA
jgi:hypothetical protein